MAVAETLSCIAVILLSLCVKSLDGSFTSTPGNTVGCTSDSVTFNWVYNNPTDADIVSWNFGTQKILDFEYTSGNIIVDPIYTGRVTHNSNGVITLLQLTESDAGDYSCSVTYNSNLPATNTATLTVYKSVSPFEVICESNQVRCGAASLDMTGIQYNWTVEKTSSSATTPTVDGEHGNKEYTCTISGLRVTNCLGAAQDTKSKSCSFGTTTTTETTTTEAFTTSQDLSSTSSSVSSEITSDNNVVSSTTVTISSSEPTTKNLDKETNNTDLSNEDIILIIVLGGVGFLLLVVIGGVVICCCVRSQKGRQHNKSKVQRKIRNGESKLNFEDPRQQGFRNHQQGDRCKTFESRMPKSRQDHHKRQNVSSGTGQHKHQYHRGGSDCQHRHQENHLYPKLEMYQYGHSNSGYYPNEAYHARGNDQRSYYSDPSYGRQLHYYHPGGKNTQRVSDNDRRQYEANWMY